MTFKGLHINKVLCPTPFEDQKSNLSKQVKQKFYCILYMEFNMFSLYLYLYNCCILIDMRVTVTSMKIKKTCILSSWLLRRDLIYSSSICTDSWTIMTSPIHCLWSIDLKQNWSIPINNAQYRCMMSVSIQVSFFL